MGSALQSNRTFGIVLFSFFLAMMTIALVCLVPGCNQRLRAQRLDDLERRVNEQGEIAAYDLAAVNAKLDEHATTAADLVERVAGEDGVATFLDRLEEKVAEVSVRTHSEAEAVNAKIDAVTGELQRVAEENAAADPAGSALLTQLVGMVEKSADERSEIVGKLATVMDTLDDIGTERQKLEDEGLPPWLALIGAAAAGGVIPGGWGLTLVRGLAAVQGELADTQDRLVETERNHDGVVSSFEIARNGESGRVDWSLVGQLQNAMGVNSTAVDAARRKAKKA